MNIIMMVLLLKNRADQDFNQIFRIIKCSHGVIVTFIYCINLFSRLRIHINIIKITRKPLHEGNNFLEKHLYNIFNYYSQNAVKLY